MYKIIFVSAFLFSVTLTLAQGTLDSVLNSIASKNKTLASYSKLSEARQLEFRTGLTPYNPTVEYDYLLGTPSNAGNQTDIMVVQSFDFPTAYIKRKKVANGQVSRLGFETSVKRQAIMIQAKIACINMIYLNKIIVQLKIRVANAKRVNKDLETKLFNEEISAIDANKAKLVLLNSTVTLKMHESTREGLLLHLTEMNGGESIGFRETIYPVKPAVPSVDSLEISIEENDPLLKIHEQDIAISELQIGLMKALALPKMEAGYHYQSILGQTFNGLHFGISIPLWENKNSVKQSKAYSLYAQAELIEHKNDHKYEIKELYERYRSLEASIAEYENVLQGLSSEELLQKSLGLGQISFIEYALEIDYYYRALDQYFHLEKELHLTLAKLYKHQL